MTISQSLTLKQSQSLVMTPQLQQAIKLLQYSSAELNEFIEDQLLQNPLLDGDTKNSDEAPFGESDAPSSADSLDTQSATTLNDMLETFSHANESPLDTDHDTLFNGSNDTPFADREPWKESSRNSFDGDETDFTERYSRTETLREHVEQQICLLFADAQERLIALYLADLLDEAGYFRAELAPLAEQLGCTEATLEKTLQRLKACDPAGVFAKDLKECLALQLIDKNRFDPAMETLLNNMEMLAYGDLSKLRKLCGVTEEDFRDMIREIKALNPKPAVGFNNTEAETLIADVLMHPSKNGGWVLELSADNLPRVLVNTHYFTTVQAQSGKKDKEYLAQCYQSANWLVKALHQRATTILKVSAEIVEQQQLFFRHGIHYLKPMVLREIAAATGLHESTISRVTSNKYINTPRGIFELKYFFSAGLGSDTGDMSALAVKHRLKALIDSETAQNILSDDELMVLLDKEGIRVARRTLAKYREAMGIPSSVERRRLKRRG
jgi:RNA polymerase sigma-54 factor